MKLMNLDFLNTKARSKHRSNTILAFLLLVIAIGMLIKHQSISTNIAEAKNRTLTPKKPVLIQAPPTIEDLRKLQSVKAVQQKLNLPWQTLLTALEEVKKKSPTVSLMIIQPDPIAGDVLLVAEAPNQGTVLAFVTLLEHQSNLFDVLLMSQRKLGVDHNSHLTFTLKMGWKI